MAFYGQSPYAQQAYGAGGYGGQAAYGANMGGYTGGYGDYGYGGGYGGAIPPAFSSGGGYAMDVAAASGALTPYDPAAAQAQQQQRYYQQGYENAAAGRAKERRSRSQPHKGPASPSPQPPRSATPAAGLNRSPSPWEADRASPKRRKDKEPRWRSGTASPAPEPLQQHPINRMNQQSATRKKPTRPNTPVAPPPAPSPRRMHPQQQLPPPQPTQPRAGAGYTGPMPGSMAPGYGPTPGYASPPPGARPPPPSMGGQANSPQGFQQTPTDSLCCLLRDKIWVCNYEVARDFAILTNLNITHVLNTANECRCMYPEHFQYKQLTLFDQPEEDITPYLVDTCQWMEQVLSSGGRLLVHCNMGKSRSVSCILYYLMIKYGWTMSKAQEHVKAKRGFCNPNRGYISAIVHFHYTGGDTPCNPNSRAPYSDRLIDDMLYLANNWIEGGKITRDQVVSAYHSEKEHPEHAIFLLVTVPPKDLPRSFGGPAAGPPPADGRPGMGLYQTKKPKKKGIFGL